MILSGFVGIVDNWVGKGFELNSVVAAVIGGVALSGGRGTIPGALVGAAILVVVFNAVLLIGFPIEFQIIIKGLVIVAAAAFSSNEPRSKCATIVVIAVTAGVGLPIPPCEVSSRGWAKSCVPRSNKQRRIEE